MLVCASAGAYFHCLTALAAHSAKTGFPPAIETVCTVPRGEIITSRRPSRQCKRVSIPPDIEVLLCRLAFSDSYLHSHFQLFGQAPHAAERRRSPGRPPIGIRMPCRNVGAESTERSSCRSISFVSARITR